MEQRRSGTKRPDGERQAERGAEESRSGRAGSGRKDRGPQTADGRRAPQAAAGRRQSLMAASRLRPLRAGWLGTSRASSSRCAAPGPGGRIVKADVEAAAGAGAPPRAAARPRRRLPAPTAAAAPAPASAKGEVAGRRAHPPPADGRAAHGRVEGDGPALLPRDRDRHDGGGRRARAAEADRRRRAARSDLQRHGREGLRARAARVPARQRLLPRRPLRALLARQRRRSRSRRSDALVVPDDLRRRPQVARRDRRGRARARAQGARRDHHAAGALGRHLHGVEPRDVRRHQLLRRDQPAAGGAAVGRRAAAEGGRGRFGPCRRARR